MSTYFHELDRENLPRHVGIVMDGNGRWAKQRGLPLDAAAAKHSLERVVALPPSFAGDALTLDLTWLSADDLRVTWFEPATGRTLSGGTLRRGSGITLGTPFTEEATVAMLMIVPSARSSICGKISAALPWSGIYCVLLATSNRGLRFRYTAGMTECIRW